MVWHSTTEYIGGHSDMTGGALITRYDNYLFGRHEQIGDPTLADSILDRLVHNANSIRKNRNKSGG